MTEAYTSPVVSVKRTRTAQPQTPTGIDWSNPITRALEFAYLPGQRVDSAKKIPGVKQVGAGTSAKGSSLAMDGLNSNTGLPIYTGALLGALASSTVVAVARTGAVLGNGEGQLGTNGNSVYCERGSAGSDIYKLEAISSDAVVTRAQFTYRNDAGSILQTTIAASAPLNDGADHFYALVKSGSNHSVFIDTLRSSASFVGAVTFTDSTNESRIGSDKGDIAAPWKGEIGVVAGWSRALSDVEVRSLSANPWQIFSPVRTGVFVPQVAGQTPSIAPRQPVTPRQTQMMGTAGVGVASVTPYAPRGCARSRQPQYPVGLNSALRTDFASSPTLDKPVSVNAAIQIACGTQGRQYLFTGTANNTTYVDFGEKATDIFTSAPGWAMFVFNPGPSGSWVTAYIASKSSANNTQGWNLFFTAAGALQMNLISSANMNWASAAGVLQSNTQHTIIVSYSGDVTSASCLTIWVNGVKITPASSNGGSGHTTDLTFPLRLGYGQVGNGGMSFPLNGKIALSAFGRKQLADAEALSLNANPWQIFAPDNRKIWVPT